MQHMEGESIDLKSSGLSHCNCTSIKAMLLLVLTRPLRSADLASFQLPNIRYLPEGLLLTYQNKVEWESL